MCVPPSASEVEYVALGDAVGEALFRSRVWRFLCADGMVPLPEAVRGAIGRVAVQYIE